jgi:uncharacterized protein YciU (UPF0263 family)
VLSDERASTVPGWPRVNFTREVESMTAPLPSIGDWYRQKEGGALFEVVAYDDDDGTIEIQYFDGTVEEMDIEDWEGQWEDGALEIADPPEDWSGSVDVDSDEDTLRADVNGSDHDRRGNPLEGIDLFE